MSITMVLFALLWLLFAPQSGLLVLIQKRSIIQELRSETEGLALENTRLQAEIERLENDQVYLEEVARRDYQMLKPNERVYDFSQPAQTGKR